VGDHTFVGGPSSFFGSRGYSLLAKEIHSSVQIASIFSERFFAIHETRIGHLAQLANEGCSNFWHSYSLLIFDDKRVD
jgi:hypothetical protein